MVLKLKKIWEGYYLSSNIQAKQGDNNWCITSSNRLFKHEEYSTPVKGDMVLIASTILKQGLLPLNKSEIEKHLSFLNRKVDVEDICIQCTLKKPKWQHLLNLPQRPMPTFFWNEVDSAIDGYNLSKEIGDKIWSDEDMLKASKYGYEFRDETSFPEQKFEDACINNTKQFLLFLAEKNEEWDIEIETHDCGENEDCLFHKYYEKQPTCDLMICKKIKPLLTKDGYVKIKSIK